MSRNARHERGSAPEASQVPPSAGSRVETLCLAALLSLIPLRAVLPETPSLETPSWTRRLDAPAGPMPGATLVFAGVIFGAAAALVSVRLWRGGPRYVATGAEWGVAVVVLAGVISTCVAGQKRVAITGVVDFAGLLIFFLVLRQLLARAWTLRLALCVVLATGAVVACKGIYQVAVEYPETLEHYRQFVAPQFREGLDPREEGKLHDFEQRINSGLATAFFTHSNVAATYLGIIILTALAVIRSRLGATAQNGLASSRVRTLAPCAAPATLAIIALIALWLTQSKGAGIALAAAMVLWGCLIVARRWLSVHARAGAALFWTLVLAITLGTVGYGVAKGGLPSLSMLYRWQYWRGSVAMIRDVGIWGVGANNFGNYFPRYKPVECPEEVQDPHSWIVCAAAEWGIMGLLGLVLMWAGLSRRIALDCESGTRARDGPGSGQHLVDVAPQAASMPAWLFGIAVVLVIGFAAVNSDAFGSAAQTGFIISTVAGIAATWMAAFAIMSAESNDVGYFRDDALRGVRPGLIVAAIAFLLHAAIDLALFWPGAATTFFAVLAIAMATDGRRIEAPERDLLPQPLSSARPRRGLAVAWSVAGAIGLVSYAAVIVQPPVAAGKWLTKARTLPRAHDWNEFVAGGGLDAYQRAIAADPRDGTAVDELLDELLDDRALLIRSTEQCDEALRWVELLRRRDPDAGTADGHAARIHTIRYQLTGDLNDLRRASEALARNVERYPTSPDRRLAYGYMLAQRAELEQSSDLRRRAAEQLELALTLDTQRTYVSQPNRLTAEQRRQLNEDIARLRGTSR